MEEEEKAVVLTAEQQNDPLLNAQLQQLEQMGFGDKALNLRILMKADGNLQVAIQKLLDLNA